MSTREEHQRMKKQAIRKAMDVLRGDNAYDNIECVILSIKRFPDEVQEHLWDAVAEVQDEFLPRVGEAAVAYLEAKLDRMERNR